MHTYQPTHSQTQTIINTNLQGRIQTFGKGRSKSEHPFTIEGHTFSMMLTIELSYMANRIKGWGRKT